MPKSLPRCWTTLLRPVTFQGGWGRWKAKIHCCLDDLDGFRMVFWMENGSDDSDGVLCIHIWGGVIAVIIITIIMIIR